MSADCKWAGPRIVAYVDGELPDADIDRLAAHLRECPDCAAVERSERNLTARVRSAASKDRAPEGLAWRIGAALAAEAGPAAAPADEVSEERRRGSRWAALVASAAAAALLLIVAGGIFWPGSGQRFMSAMAAEHYEHSAAAGGPHDLEVLSAETAELERYLTGKLGAEVRLPAKEFPGRRGACCCKRGGCDMGLVACFCAQRSKAVSVFVVRADAVSLRGLEQVKRSGRSFWRGSAGECRAAMWRKGDLLYALVGELEPEDALTLAGQAAAAVEAR